jgi:ADP-heptose:LPS heptosyltransferase
MGIGDQLMAAGEARRAHEQTGRFVVILDKFGRPQRDPVWRGTPYIIPSLSVGAVQIRNHGGCRPYIAEKRDDRWVWRDYTPIAAKLYFTAEESRWRARGEGRIILEPSLKAKASQNKRWPIERWLRLADALRARGYRLAQFPGDTQLPEVEQIATPTFRHAAAVLAGARAAVLHEGGLHHAAAAVKTRAVVIYGGYISPRQTGYELHANLFTGGDACGMRMPCAHCRMAMAAITVESVITALESLL